MSLTKYIVLIGYIFSIADADVTVTVENGLDDQGSMKCGFEVTLVCAIQNYTGDMTWKVDNVTAMECKSSSCQPRPPYHPNYAFTFQSANGKFSLAITPVQVKDNGVVFECSDGTDTATIVAAVKVLPDNTTTVLSVTDLSVTTTIATTASTTTASAENTTLKTEKEIMVTTGCVFPAENLNIKWFYFKEGEEPLPYTEVKQTDALLNASVAGCTGDCGGDGVSRMTSALLFEEDTSEESEAYFLRAIASSSDFSESVIVTSDVSYKLKFSDDDTSWLFSGAKNTGLIIALSVVGVIILVTIVVIVVVCLRTAKNPEKERIMPN